ncbi:MAG: hypothetical protein D6803_01080 [Anaerolineae bacterium]|nr:MAG: hypothetical protein D6803_01080 [Anaerolineae bacterium]
MAAIQRHVLARQLKELAATFESPERFCAGLLEIFDFYADHTLRVRNAKDATPRLREFHVPPLLLREVEKFLAPYIQARPQQALALADALWAETCLETRRLAAWILGQVRLRPPSALLERLNKWSEEALEDAVLKELATRSVSGLSSEAPDLFLAQMESWLTDEGAGKVRLGLYALAGWASKGAEEHGPTMFRWLAPHLRHPDRLMIDALQEALEALIVSLPQESAFFLQEMLGATPPRELVSLCRRVLPLFPPEEENLLRSHLRELRRAG